MVISLTVEESGIIRYVRRPGTLLEAGCVVARLELDDPTKVHLVSSGAAGRHLGEREQSPPGSHSGFGPAWIKEAA